jgi:hypothetical protein
MECDVNIKESVRCVDSSHWRYNYAADVDPPSSPLAFVTKMSEKRKFTSPTANQMKNQQKSIGKEEKLDIRSQPVKGEQIFYICSNVSFAHISVHTIHDNADRITERAQSGTKVFV